MKRAVAFLILSLVLLIGALVWRMGPPPAGIAPEFDMRPNHAPIVLVFGGSEGGRFAADHPLISALSHAGFHVGRVAYFGAPDTPAKLDRIALDPIDALVSDVADRPEVDARCVFVAGASKGAELALLLASGNDRIGAVAAIAPTHVVFQSSRITPLRNSSWRRGDQPIAFVPFPWSLATLRGIFGQGYRDMHLSALENDAAVTRALIPAERIAGPVLLIGAAQDSIWPSDVMARAVASRLAENGFAHTMRLKIEDHGHYLLDSAGVREEVVTFLSAAARARECLVPMNQ